jgi:zinc/manganese transport system permease protein
MHQVFQFLLAPLLASLVLLVITSYFGIHVIKREIIFIDIALAQVAAMGGIMELFIENKLHDIATFTISPHFSELIAYTFSLLFCLIAAIVFTYLRNPRIKVPIEAFIGIAYAFATTATVIILDKGAGGDVHLHDVMIGTLLWTTWPGLIRLIFVVSVIGGFHFIFRKHFIQLTEIYHDKTQRLKQYWKWDFLFYFTFGIIIIEAIRIGGILTVFAFLISPASFSALFAKKWGQRIFLALCAGIISAFAGLFLSMKLDVTSSPLIIIIMGIILVLGFLTRKFLALKNNP